MNHLEKEKTEQLDTNVVQHTSTTQLHLFLMLHVNLVMEILFEKKLVISNRSNHLHPTWDLATDDFPSNLVVVIALLDLCLKPETNTIIVQVDLNPKKSPSTGS